MSWHVTWTNCNDKTVAAGIATQARIVDNETGRVGIFIPSFPNKPGKRDALLMAAAPDLLAALKAIAEFPITDPANQDAFNMALMARQAVAKLAPDHRAFLYTQAAQS